MTLNLRFLMVSAAMLLVTALPRMATGAPAATGPPCGRHDVVVAFLAETYDETSVGRGVRSDGLMVELLVAPQGSWTIIVTHPMGMSCLASDGDDWETIASPRHEVAAPEGDVPGARP